MFSGSRLSGMLAALAGVTSGGLSATKPPDQPEASTSAGPSATVERRRSQRLSAKSAAAATEPASEPPAVEAGPSIPPPASLGSSAEPPTSAAGEDSFGDNADFTADFTDDDVEAEVGSSLPHILMIGVELRRLIDRCLTTRWIPKMYRRKRQLRCRSQMVCGFACVSFWIF